MDELRCRKLVTRAENDPSVLKTLSYQDVEVCAKVLDRCEERMTLGMEDGCLVMAVANLAEDLGDRLLRHRAYELLAHFYAGYENPEHAERYLYGMAELGDCGRECRFRYLLRRADCRLLTGQPLGALEGLKEVEALGDLTADERGRVGLVRATAFLRMWKMSESVESAGAALRELDLASPLGYFMESVTLLAWAVQNEDDCRASLEHLALFKERCSGQRRFAGVRTRTSWIEGHLLYILKRRRQAQQRLESAARRLVPHGRVWEAVAVSLDQAQMRCVRPTRENMRQGKRILLRCVRGRDDLEAPMKSHLTWLAEEVFMREPEKAFEELYSLRQFYTKPFPGVLGRLLATGSTQVIQYGNAEASG